MTNLQRLTWATVISSAAIATGCGASHPDDGAGTTSTGGAPAHEYAAVVRGKLVSTDIAKDKMTHDGIAKGAEAPSKAAGDHAHDVLLGTTMLDSVENEFLAVDRWNDAAAMKAFYADPKIQAAFGSLFSAPPTVQFFELQPTWANWGDMSSGKSFNPYYYHFAIGQLANADSEKNHAAHDQVASGGKAPALGAGNVAHVVFLGVDDPRQFLAIDIWGKSDNLVAFYTNPQFVAAFAPLFSKVSQPVYHSTDWYQW